MSIATLTVAAFITILAVSVAQATPTKVNVRIEGKHETLFEGPILTEGHDVRASSDTRRRSCDGVNPNDAENVTPGATPTAASADAMGIVGESFDGKWYPGYQDYLVTRWGPDREEGGGSWGIFVNDVLTDVGGCQYELSEGDEVLWVYNAFEARALLELYPAGNASGAPPLTATAELNKPFDVEVLESDNDAEGKPPAVPERTGLVPYMGADVSPVRTSSKGFEKVQTESPATVETDAQGKTSIIFTEAGWHRIKATATGFGDEEDAVRSNRLDVCVPVNGSHTCPDPLPEDLVRPALPAEGEAESPDSESRETTLGSEDRSEASNQVLGATNAATANTVRTTAIASKGSSNSRTNPFALRVSGKMLASHDDRWSGLHYGGRWRQLAQSAAWLGTVSRGSPGAWVSLRLRAGRPLFLMRDTSRTAKIEVRTGSHSEVFPLAGGSIGSLRLITAMGRSHAGTVSLRVLKGTVDLDGVAVES